MKKKWIVIIVLAIALLLGLVFWGFNTSEEEPAQTETNTETTQELFEPEWETGVIRASLAEAVYGDYDKYDIVTVVGTYGDYYIVQGDEYNLLVEKRYIRLVDEDAFTETVLYANSGASVYETVYMRKEPVESLALNTEVTVLEGKEDWVYVKWDGGEGYMLRSWLLTSPVIYSTTPDNSTTEAPSTSVPSSPSSPSTPSSPAEVDGTDVDIGQLSAQNTEAQIILLGDYQGPKIQEKVSTNGVILAHNVEGYLTLWNRGDEIKVTDCDDEQCTIWVEDELYVTLPRYLVWMEGDNVYETWKGYADSQADVFEEYQLRNSRMQLAENTEVEVLDYLESQTYNHLYSGCYIVRIDGKIGYMRANEVSSTEYITYSGGSDSYSSGDSYGGSGSYDDNYGGGSNDSGSSEQTGDVWTPPTL